MSPRPSAPGSHFEPVVQAGCLFARRAAMHLAKPPWNPASTIEANIERMMPDFLSCVASQDEVNAADAWVLAVRQPELVCRLADLASTTRRILCAITEHETPGRDLLRENIGDSSWQLTWFGLDWFVVAFGPCYSVEHPRYSHSPDTAYLMMQPVISFERFGITTEPKSYPLRRRIRDDFAKRGLPLDEALMETSIMAEKFVKPLGIGDDAIRWWR